MTTFDLCGPLPEHTTMALEASAGTGKTYTIAALATRYVAERGVPIEDILIVTFTRFATSELSSRVFDRFTSARSALTEALATGQQPSDPVDQLLVSDPTETQCRIERLDRAIAGIDSATIATTHQFCQTMLGQLGVLADHDEASHFTDDITDLVEQATADAFIERFAYTANPPTKFDPWHDIGRQAALLHPDVRLDEKAGGQAPRLEFAKEVRRRVEDAKRRRGMFTFDDMVDRVRGALTDPATARQAADVLARRFPIVLIDEFQDTDPAQWDIIRNAFVGRSTVVLIGDPKQSIYAFRNADIEAYLDALTTVDTVATLPTNYRSDPGMVEAVNDLFDGATLGDPRIVVRPVAAACDHRVVGSDFAPLRIRAVDIPEPVKWKDHEQLIVDDVAGYATTMLASDLQVIDQGVARPIRPSDIAILVQVNRLGDQIQSALTRHGQPSIFSGATSVFHSAAAREWLTLLDALIDPRQRQVVMAGLTDFMGETLSTLGQGDERVLSRLALDITQLSHLMERSGVLRAIDWLSDHRDLDRRLLSQPDGERKLTDVKHIAEELDRVQRRERWGIAALRTWLDNRISHSGGQDTSHVRRLETEREAVNIMTVHGAKGLEFGFVLLPDFSQPVYGRSTDRASAMFTRPFLYHDGTSRVLDLGDDHPTRDDALSRCNAEQRNESLRKLYVAITRARHGATVWWLNSPTSPLQRLLYGHQGPGNEPKVGVAPIVVPPDDLRLDPTVVAVDRIDPAMTPPAPTSSLAPQSRPQLTLATFEPMIDTHWTRTSYSGLTATSHDALPPMLGHEPDEALEDEGVDEVSPTPDGALEASPADSPLIGLPGGTGFGSLVHEVLEVVDPSSSTLAEDVRQAVDQAIHLAPVDVDADALSTGLVEVLHTPLGNLTSGASLSDLGASNRLAELDFEMPLCQLPPSALRPTVGDLADLWRQGLIFDDDPLKTYGDYLAASPAAETVLAGFITGSIDAVLRIPGSTPRYVVVDYKTNRLPCPPGQIVHSSSYTQAAMAELMITSHYPLQALVYSVALHRMLQRRQPGYDPATHLGGVGYLFVRGMTGGSPSDASPTGVFSWYPSAELIVRASTILAGGGGS